MMLARGCQRPAIAAAPRRAAAAARPTVAVGAQQKVNKRGKVASRPGPQSGPSPKQAREERQLRRLEQQQQQQEQPVAGDVDSAPVDPSLDAAAAESSSSSSSSSARAPSGPSTTPQVVVDRMFRRMIVSAGVPVLLGLMMLPVFWYARVVAKIEWLPPWLVYLASGTMFGGGLLGITYGILSTSWEPRREGSALGFDEFKANVALLVSRRQQ